MLHATPLTLLLTLIIAGEANATASSVRAERLWPLPIEINLSSSFGEYRSGHLHAGVDIRTFGREGVECLAVDDGYVSRMRASPNGYGKAIYLKLATGETVVYAHLSEFQPRLEEALYGRQLEEGQYKVDAYFEPEQFPVRRGDVIGYTGSTGTSAPHLHFEVRDERENPMNPLSAGWELDDRTPATFQGAVWIPLSAASRIDGDCRPRRLNLRRIGGANYVAADTVEIDGRAGLGMRIVDRINASSGRLAPYSVELTVEGVLLASVTMESFTYGHAGEVELAYDMEAVRARNQHYLLLFHRTGESLWHRTFVNDGVIDAKLMPTLVGESKRSYTAIVRASDRAGNVATVMLPFRLGSTTTTARRHTGTGDTPERVPGCFFFENIMSLRSSESEFAFVSADGAEIFGIDGPDQLAFSAEDLLRDIAEPWPGRGTPHNGHRRGMHAILPRDGSSPKRYVIPLRAGEGQRSTVGDVGIELVSGPGTLYSDAIVYAGRWTVPKPLRSQDHRIYDFVHPAVEVGPLSLVLHKPMELRFTHVPDADPRAAVYGLDESKGEWNYEVSEAQGDTVSAWVGGPGVYAVLVDRVPPRISQPALAKRRSYATGAVTPEITIAIEDDGSGVDDQRTIVSINGKKLIARWDGFANTMYVPIRNADRHGGYRVAVVAFDRCGNESTVDTRITTRK